MESPRDTHDAHSLDVLEEAPDLAGDELVETL